MSTIQSNPDASVIVSEKAVYVTSSRVPVAASDNEIAANRIKDPVQKTLGSTQEFAKWGDNNLFPQEAKANAELSTLIKPVIEWKTQALYGGGLEYGTEVDGEFVAAKHPEVENLLKRGGGNRYLMESIQQFYYYYNVFPRIYFSANLKKAAAINVISCQFGRYSAQNPTTGALEKLYISANWQGISMPSDATELPLIDPYYNPEDQVASGKKTIYVYPISYPDADKLTYSLAAWHTAITSKWFALLKAIPEFKASLLKNQATIKYHIEIHVDYWKWKWPNFYDLPAEDQIKLKKEEIAAFEKIAFGAENAGRTIFTPTYTDPKTGEVKQHWRITPLDNKLLSGSYIEDSQEAADHIMFSLGLDGTLIGKTPGKSMGTGGGSDKRIAFNAYIANCKMHEDIILEPICFMARYNQWKINGQEIIFRFKHTEITTLNTGTETVTQNTPKQ